MLSQSLFCALASLGFASLGLADYAVTIPWVGYSSSGNYFDEWQGEFVAENSETTTYHIEPHCPASSHCPTLEPPITLIVATNTYELITTNPNGFIGYSSSACTLTGSPSPTAAHCSYTDSYEYRSSTTTDSDTMNVPDDLFDFEVYPVTLTVAGSGSTGATGTTADTMAETTGSSTESTSETASNSRTSGGGSGSASATASATTSGNIAVKTNAPMLVMGGILAGAVLLN
ncbi:hypothetical protein N7508_000216 [Penicillium antarcticum]|uniref:uncharacterized protein n=1 Tax=Penicillium antarcticum TaxID=416450 RepID=UPI00239B7095|nr:uncharacterized protein N7508_000216 [Penicillium antarcticum]KAJ5319933.1 hypothetical protein N7508_000216 [Penicillium antarcticum]